MRQSIFFILLLVSSFAWALDAQEEALILNQELQFLEESVQTEVIPETTAQSRSPTRAIPTESLERTYFGDEAEDSVSTKTSGLKRRSF